MGRLFPSDFLHGLNQGLVAYLLGWTLQMLYVLPLVDESYEDVSVLVIRKIQEFPAHNSFYPIRHKRFEDITALLKQERKVSKAADVFGNTDLIALTETWKIPTALFQLLLVIISGKIFPSDLKWAKKHGIDNISFNMERCFINAIVGCIEIYWYANAPDLCDIQVDTYRSVISNAQSHFVILHHVRVLILNKLSIVAWENAKAHSERRKKFDRDESGSSTVHRSKKSGIVQDESIGSQSSKKSLGEKKFVPKALPEKPKLGKRFCGTIKFHLLQHFPEQGKISVV
jgi:hypothetical protein